MPFVNANGIRLSYQRSGRGEPILLIMGTGAAGSQWTMFQTPALQQAGYETITLDNRGIRPSDAPAGVYRLADLVADTKGVIEALGLGPCRLVGTSLGSMIVQELAIAEPQLVHSAVLLATRARSDALRRAQTRAERALAESGVELPPKYRAANAVLHMLSPRTLDDDQAVSSWLEIFELAGGGGAVAPGQAGIDAEEDRRPALRQIVAPCRVISFADDVITPPHLGAEVADAISDCDLVEIPGCGHLGHLERPEPVNEAILEFFAKH